MKQGLTGREYLITDMNEITRILENTKIVHIGMVDEEGPYVVPMNYGYAFENDQLVLYVHGSLKGRKIDAMRNNPDVFIEISCDVQQFEGKMACQYGTSYYCVMGKGKAEILDDVEDKKAGLSLFMKSHTGKDFEFNDKMVSMVSVIRIIIPEYTAKHRPMPKTPTV